GKLRQYKEQLHLDLQNISEEKLQLRQRLETSRRAQLASIQLAQLSSEITRLRKENHSIELQAEKLPQEREKLLLQVESSQRKLEGLQLKKENQLLVASNEELRRKLENGKPCFVCGSLEHPYAIELPEMEDSLETEIKSASEEWRHFSHQLSTVSATLETLRKRLKEISN